MYASLNFIQAIIHSKTDLSELRSYRVVFK